MSRTAYKCSECDFFSWIKMPKCKSCGALNSFVVDTEEKQKESLGVKRNTINTADLPNRYEPNVGSDYSVKRITFRDNSLNLLFGGGIPVGGVYFLTAEPGAGKSTFLGQLPGLLNKKVKVLYYSGEENQDQVYGRLNKIHNGDREILDNIDLYYGNNIEEIVGIMQRDKPDIFVIDSLNAISQNSLSKQVENMERIVKIAKTYKLTGFVIGHITKSGETGGRKTLEHEVDGILMLKGQEDRSDSVRIMKVLKNRYGGTDNVSVMKIGENGFTIISPAEAMKIFIEESPNTYGSAFASILEGNQLFIIEIQSLLSESAFSMPQIIGLGISKQAMSVNIGIIRNLLQANPFFQKNDVFVKIFGPNLKMENIDLGVVASIISYYLQISVKEYIFVGNVDLTGQIRSIPKQEEIIKKLKSYGYDEKNIITREKFKNILDFAKFLSKKGKTEKK